MHFFRNLLFSQSVNCKYLHSGTKSSGWLYATDSVALKSVLQNRQTESNVARNTLTENSYSEYKNIPSLDIGRMNIPAASLAHNIIQIITIIMRNGNV